MKRRPITPLHKLKAGVPKGGTTGQTLVKVTNANYDTDWAASAGGGSVTTFSSGALSPLFTTSVANPTTTPALSYSLSNAGGHTFLGNSGSGAAAPTYHAIGLSDLPASLLTSVLQGRTLYVDGTNGNDGTGARGDVTKPFLTIAAAVAAASSGDVVKVGPGTFAFGTATLQLPANVSLIGAGIDVTKITGTAGTGTGHAIVAPGNSSFISDLTSDGTNSNANPTAPMGVLASDTAATNAVISRCKIVGSSDGFYYEKAGTTGIKHYDCIVPTTFDTTFHSVNGGIFEYFNCDFTGDGTVGGALSCRGLNTSNGAIARSYGCKFNMTNPTGESVSGYASGAGSTTELYNCRSAVSGSTSFDLKQVSSATVNYSGLTRSDGAALTTSGTVTHLSRYLIRDNNLSDVVTPATARTNLGLAIGTNVQAWDADLDALAALAGTNNIYYRSAANTWSSVTIGSGVAFAGGTLSATGSGGTVTSVTGTSPVVSSGGNTPAISLDVSVDHAFTAAQSVTLNDATTNAPVDALLVSHNTTGTPANGHGPQITFKGETSTTTDQVMGRLKAIYTDVTHATRSARFVFSLENNGGIGPTDLFYIWPSGGVGNQGSDPGTGIIGAQTGFKVNNAAGTGGQEMVSDGTKFAVGNSAPDTMQDYGFINVPDTGNLNQPDQLTLSGTTQATLAGTGSITLFEPANNPPGKRSFSPGSFILKAGEYLVQYLQLILNGTQQVTLTGDSCLFITDFVPHGSLTLS